MLSLDLRPAKFSDMCGQDLVKKSLMHICKSPESSPKCILLCGNYGSRQDYSSSYICKST